MKVRAADAAAGAGLAAAGVLLAWACVAQMVSGLLVRDAPWLALRWDPDDSTALARAAEQQVRGARNDADFALAADLARRALTAGPMEATALRVLGMAQAQAGNVQASEALMSVAGRRTQRDGPTQTWMIDRNLRSGDYDQAFTRADSMLRRDPGMAETLHPAIIERLEADPRAAAPLTARLAASPSWRTGFLTALAGRARDVDLALRVFDGLNAGPARPTDREVAALTARLVSQGDYARASAAWTRFLPAAAGPGSGLIYDGDFQGRPGAAPFNWRWASQGGVFAGPGEAPDGGRALMVEFPGATPAEIGAQLLTLAPGAYRLSGEAFLADSAPVERLAWSLRCAGSNAPLAEARQGGDGGRWRSLAAVFRVPATGCGAQWLRLRSLGGESFQTSTAWYRRLAVEPAA